MLVKKPQTFMLSILFTRLSFIKGPATQGSVFHLTLDLLFVPKLAHKSQNITTAF